MNEQVFMGEREERVQLFDLQSKTSLDRLVPIVLNSISAKAERCDHHSDAEHFFFCILIFLFPSVKAASSGVRERERKNICAVWGGRDEFHDGGKWMFACAAYLGKNTFASIHLLARFSTFNNFPSFRRRARPNDAKKNPQGLPHVIYCRLWRWPDLSVRRRNISRFLSTLILTPFFSPFLQSHNDLNYLSHCEFAYHLKKDEICINPYHYIKAEPEFIQPQSPQQQLSILVPKFPTSSPESSTVSSYLDDLSNTVPLNIQYNALK